MQIAEACLADKLQRNDARVTKLWRGQMLNGTGLRLCGAVLASGLAAPPVLAGTYTTLYQFTGGSDGAVPPSSLAYDEKGDLYGVTETGGNACPKSPFPGCGTVYKISPSGQESTLVTFTGSNGENPKGPLTLVNHTLYGSAFAGGAHSYGVLFSVHADGSRFRLLHTFDGQDGYEPTGPLVSGPAGVFYGITVGGGPNMRRAYAGVLFELLPDGKYKQLHDFTGGADGGGPNTLLIDASGTLYGSTEYGESCPGERYCGVVFQYVPSTATFTVLHQFTGTEGANPMLGSIGPDGTLYGATQSTGRENPGGWLFALMPTGGTYNLTTALCVRRSPRPRNPAIRRAGAHRLWSPDRHHNERWNSLQVQVQQDEGPLHVPNDEHARAAHC